MGVSLNSIELNHSAIVHTVPLIGGKRGESGVSLTPESIITNQGDLEKLLVLLHGSKVHFGLSCLARRDILGETDPQINLKNELDLSKIHPQLQSQAQNRSRINGELALQQIGAVREQLVWFQDQDHYLVIPEAGIFADTFYLKRLAEMMAEPTPDEPFNFQTFFSFYHKVKTVYEVKQPPSRYQTNLFRAFDRLNREELELFLFKTIVNNENPFAFNSQLTETIEKLGFSDDKKKQILGYQPLDSAETYLTDRTFMEVLAFLNEQITGEAEHRGKFPEFKGNLNTQDIERIIVIYGILKAREEMRYLVGGRAKINSPLELKKILTAFPDLSSGAGDFNKLLEQLGQFGREVFSPLTARPDVLVLYCPDSKIIKDMRNNIMRPLYEKRRNPAVLQNLDFMRSLAINAEERGLKIILGDWKVSLGGGFEELPPKYTDELYYYLLLFCKRVSGFRENCEGVRLEWDKDPIIKVVAKGLVVSLKQVGGRAGVSQFRAFGAMAEDGQGMIKRLKEIEELNLRAATVAHVIRENGYHQVIS